jgi:dTDP-glucose pyrophosphorylase
LTAIIKNPENNKKSQKLKPSGLGELEITDVNNFYIQKVNMKYSVLKGYKAT